jgi:hypothetical protein
MSGSIPDRGRRYFHPPKCQTGPLSSYSLLSTGHWSCVPRVKAAGGVQLTTHLSDAEFKNDLSDTFIPPHTFLVCTVPLQARRLQSCVIYSQGALG